MNNDEATLGYNKYIIFIVINLYFSFGNRPKDFSPTLNETKLGGANRLLQNTLNCNLYSVCKYL